MADNVGTTEKDNKMVKANKNNNLTANSMNDEEISGKILFTMSIPKKAWCGSVKPCSEQCEIHKFMNSFNFKYMGAWGAPTNIEEKADFVIVKTASQDTDLLEHFRHCCSECHAKQR